VPPRDDAELVVDGRAGPEDAQQRLQQGEVDHLAPPVAEIAVVERGQHRVRPGDARDAVGEAERRQRGRAVLLAGLVGEPAHRLHQRAERAALLVRPVLAEAGDAQHHQPRVALQQDVRAEPPLLQHAGAEVLDEHVGVGGELAQQLLALRGWTGSA
jgi:hypothetical protein